MTRIMLLSALALALCKTALAQSSDSQFSSAQNAIEKSTMLVANGACRGSQMDNNLAGLPGNQADDIRCQSITTFALGCNTLAEQAASYLSDVDDGQETFDSIEQSIDNTVSSDAAASSGALVLAQQAPSGTIPTQLLNEVFSTCIETIKR